MSRVQDPSVYSVGGRGGEREIPKDTVQHVLHMRTVSESTHEDHYVSAAEAFAHAKRRLKALDVKFTVDEMSITYTGHNSDTVTLTYREPETLL